MHKERQQDHFGEELMQRLLQAIDDFYEYQVSLERQLKVSPSNVLSELAHWNNVHQRGAEVLKFYMEEFLAALEKGDFSRGEALRISESVERLKTQEERLYDRIYEIRKELTERKRQLQKGIDALGHYAESVSDVSGKSRFLSHDA